MITNKILRLSMILVMLYIFPMTLFTQEDISVKFSFKRPNEFVCEIQNMTEYEMSILLSKEEAEGHSDLYFDSVGLRNDTTRNVFYGLMQDVNNQSQILRLNSGESYTISYKEYFRFIKAHVYIKYGVRSPTPIYVAHYRKTFDLKEVRRRAYCRPALKEDEQ